MSEPTTRQKLSTLADEQLEPHDAEAAVKEYDEFLEEGMDETDAFNEVCESYDIDPEL
jgi:hypothetical protein